MSPFTKQKIFWDEVIFASKQFIPETRSGCNPASICKEGRKMIFSLTGHEVGCADKPRDLQTAAFEA